MKPAEVWDRKAPGPAKLLEQESALRALPEFAAMARHTNTEKALVLKQPVTEESAGRSDTAWPDKSKLYRRPAMVITPWGESDTLRDQKLSPGRANPAEAVRESQQRRSLRSPGGDC